MFACLAGGYSREPLTGLPDRIGEVRRAAAAGELDDPGHAAAVDDFVREILDEQQRARLDVLCDGGVRWDDPFQPIIRGFGGLAAGGRIPLLDTGLSVQQPLAVGDIRWETPVYAQDWTFAMTGRDIPVKQVLPGPYTLGRLTDAGSRSREAVTLAYAEALNQELRSIVEAGCLLIQVDEDAAVAIGEHESERSLFSEAQRRLLAGLEDPELVHVSLAVSGGNAAAAGPATFFDLPYSSYFYDLINGPENLQLILQAPPERGIICGAADAAVARPDDVEALVYVMAWAATANDRGSIRVAIAPSGSLAQIPRNQARAKLELLALTINVALAGPVAEVAVALEPDPLHNRQYPDLRRLAAQYEAARAAIGLAPAFSG